MAKKATIRRQYKDKGNLYLNAMSPESSALKEIPVKVECVIRFASDRRIAFVSRDGNESLNAVFGDDDKAKLNKKKLQRLISHFKLENPKQLKGKMVDVLTSADHLTILDISAR